MTSSALQRLLEPFRRVRRSLLAAARRLDGARSEASFWEQLERFEALPACVAFQPFVALRANWPLARSSSESQRSMASDRRLAARPAELERQLRRRESMASERSRALGGERVLPSGPGAVAGRGGASAAALAFGEATRPREARTTTDDATRLVASISKRDRWVPIGSARTPTVSRLEGPLHARAALPSADAATSLMARSGRTVFAAGSAAPRAEAPIGSERAFASIDRDGAGSTARGPIGPSLTPNSNPRSIHWRGDPRPAAPLRAASGVTALAAAVEALWTRTSANGDREPSGSSARAVRRGPLTGGLEAAVAARVVRTPAPTTARTVAARARSLLLPAFADVVPAPLGTAASAAAGEGGPGPSSSEPHRVDGADLLEPLQQLLLDQARARGVDLT